MNIRKIIKEEIDNFDWFDEGETPLSRLIDNFGDLTPVVRGNLTFYADNNNNNKTIFYYYQDEENGLCYINYDEIWSVLESRFGINYKEIQVVITKWLDEVYGLTGLTPSKSIW